MRFSAGRECADLFMPHMHPLNLTLASQRVCNAVKAVTNNPIDALNPGSDKRIRKLIGYSS
jgi:hypothetical protein